jgi:hypothetical protein
VTRHRRRAASASFHYALASRFTRQRAVAQLRRYAMKCGALLPQLLCACLVFVPHLSRAQGCEWARLPDPSAGVDAIEVLTYAGYGPPGEGRTLVRVDASGRTAWLAKRCPDGTLVGHLATPTFDELSEEFERALESIRGQPPRPFVSDEHPFAEILREGRMEPLCQSPYDGLDLDVIVYHDGSKEHYKCVTGALLRFGQKVLRLVPDAICASRIARLCIQRMVDRL